MGESIELTFFTPLCKRGRSTGSKWSSAEMYRGHAGYQENQTNCLKSSSYMSTVQSFLEQFEKEGNFHGVLETCFG